MIRLGSINAVLKTLVQPPSAPKPATEVEQLSLSESIPAARSQTSIASSATTHTQDEPTGAQDGHLNSKKDADEAPSISSPAATAGAQGSPSSPPLHPHTALVVLAQSGQLYASATTLDASAIASKSPGPQVLAGASSSGLRSSGRHINDLFVPHPPRSFSTASSTYYPTSSVTAVGDEDEASGSGTMTSIDASAVLPSLVGDERMRVLAGLATLSWREQLMAETPTVPLLLMTELGLILVQPLGGRPSSGEAGQWSAPNSPPITDSAVFPASAGGAPGDSAEGLLQLAQRRRAASLRSSRLLLVLNSKVDKRHDGDKPPAPAADSDAQDSEQPTHDGALRHTYGPEIEALTSVASAGAQFLGPALASLA